MVHHGSLILSFKHRLTELISQAIGFGAVYLESPVWIGETVRPELRGFFLCIMNGSIVLGQFLLS
jgi:hypothetical protein